MSKVRVRQSKNRLRSKLTDKDIQELRTRIRDPSYIDYVISELACIIFSKIGENVNLDEIFESKLNSQTK